MSEPMSITGGYVSMKEARDEHVVKALQSTKWNVKDPTVNRQHKFKDTFTSIFPSYNLSKKKEFGTTNQEFVQPIVENKADKVDKEHHLKIDSFKVYTEEMLKAKNMRMKKK